jgi:hypothetical protein
MGLVKMALCLSIQMSQTMAYWIETGFEKALKIWI